MLFIQLSLVTYEAKSLKLIYYLKSHVVLGKDQLFVLEMIETVHKRFLAYY